MCKENKKNTKWILFKNEWIKFCVQRNVHIVPYVNMNYKRNESFSKGFIYLRSLISCWINIMKYICVQASHLRKFSTVLYFVVLHLMWHIIKKLFLSQRTWIKSLGILLVKYYIPITISITTVHIHMQKHKYTSDSDVHGRMLINFLTSEFGSSTRGERDTILKSLS